MKFYAAVWCADVFAVIDDLELIGIQVVRVTDAGVFVKLQKDMAVVDRIMANRGFL